MLLHIERIRHQATAQKEVQQRRRSKSKAHTSRRSADIQNVIQRHQVHSTIYVGGITAMMVIFLHDNATCFAVDVGFFFFNTEKIELDDVE